MGRRGRPCRRRRPAACRRRRRPRRRRPGCRRAGRAGQLGDAAEPLGFRAPSGSRPGSTGTPSASPVNPGGVFTSIVFRSWLPSGRSSETEKGLWAPAPLLAPAALEARREGTLGAGAGAAGGAGGDREELGRGLVRQRRSPTVELLFDRVLCRSVVGVARSPRSEPKKCIVELGQRRLREVFEGDRELARVRVGMGRAGQLDVGAEAVGGEEEAVAVAGLRFAEVDAPGIGSGSAGLCQG